MQKIFGFTPKEHKTRKVIPTLLGSLLITGGVVAGTVLVDNPQLLNQKAQVVGYVPQSNCPNGGSKACEFPGYNGRYCRNEGGQMVIYTCNKVKGTLGCPDYWVKSLVENCSLRTDGATSCNSSGQCYQYCSPSVKCSLGSQRCGSDGVSIQQCVESKVGACTVKYWQSVWNCSVSGQKCAKGVNNGAYGCN